MMAECWASDADGGPAFRQHWFNVALLLMCLEQLYQYISHPPKAHSVQLCIFNWNSSSATDCPEILQGLFPSTSQTALTISRNYIDILKLDHLICGQMVIMISL